MVFQSFLCYTCWTCPLSNFSLVLVIPNALNRDIHLKIGNSFALLGQVHTDPQQGYGESRRPFLSIIRNTRSPNISSIMRITHRYQLDFRREVRPRFDQCIWAFDPFNRRFHVTGWRTWALLDVIPCRSSCRFIPSSARIQRDSPIWISWNRGYFFNATPALSPS